MPLPSRSSHRSGPLWPLLTAAAAIAVLGAALWSQSQGNAPCPLCILQRIAYLAVLVFALLAAAGYRLGAGRLASWLGVLAALAGLGVALKHVWLLLHPGLTCGLDPLAAVINAWPITHALPWLLQADGLCSEVPLLFGVGLPVWSALGFVVLGAALLRGALRR